MYDYIQGDICTMNNHHPYSYPYILIAYYITFPHASFSHL